MEHWTHFNLGAFQGAKTALDIAFAHLAVADDYLFGVQVAFNSIYRNYEMIFTLALRSRFAYSSRFLD